MANALIFSDYHFHLWKNFNKGNSRIKFQLDTFELLLKRAFSLKVPIFFAGDMFHTPSELNNELLSLVLPRILDIFRKYPVEFYAISGNHDLAGGNTYSRRSSSYINTFANSIRTFHVVDFETTIIGDIALHGIPYISFNQDYPDVLDSIKVVEGKFNILMNHTDYQGQKDTNGIVIGRGENLSRDMFKKFDLTLSGHVHKAGHLFGSVYSIGAPFQQRLSDMGGDFGYWTLKKGFKLQFHSLDGPKFRFYEDPKEITNTTDYWIKKPKDEVIDKDPGLDSQNLGNKRKVLKRYLKATHVRSKSKAQVLTGLLNDIGDEI